MQRTDIEAEHSGAAPLDHTPASAPGQIPSRPNRPRMKISRFAIAWIVVLLVIVAFMGYVLFETWFPPPPKPQAELTANMNYTMTIDNNGLGPGGTVEINGTVQNDGEVAGNGTVRLLVSDGYYWYDYHVPIGVLSIGESTPFHWNVHYDTVNWTDYSNWRSLGRDYAYWIVEVG